MARNKFWVKAGIVLFGHILNAPWASRMQRRRHRGLVTQRLVCSYLDRYVPYFENIPPLPDVDVQRQEERIFSIWLQGEDAAPEIVKACWRSIRKHCSQELVILDASTISDWISLPEYVLEKWRSGKMRPCHFADICRIELLYKYGGLWLDATDYVFEPMPQWLLDQDFFVYMSGEKQRGFYSFIQNCFIRARKGSYLLHAWREAVLTYWKYEDSTIDYFVHQLLFKKVVENNALAAKCFEAMPKLTQDPTHTVWFENADSPYDPELFGRLSSAALFQKTEYKSDSAKSPKPGSFAEFLINLDRP